MKRACRGIGLIELMVALTLGLIVVLGVTQIFSSARITYQSQNASAGIQEDARFVLSKMLQEIRMVGMFGCLASVNDSSTAADFSASFFAPISVIQGADGAVTLTLTTADVGTSGSTPTWNIVSDCFSYATAFSPSNTPVPGTADTVFPIRKLIYTYASNQLRVGSTLNNQAALVNNVKQFTVSFGVASSATDTVATTYVTSPPNADLIRSVRIVLVLSDPTGRVRDQQFNVVASLRNRLR